MACGACAHFLGVAVCVHVSMQATYLAQSLQSLLLEILLGYKFPVSNQGKGFARSEQGLLPACQYVHTLLPGDQQFSQKAMRHTGHTRLYYRCVTQPSPFPGNGFSVSRSFQNRVS